MRGDKLDSIEPRGLGALLLVLGILIAPPARASGSFVSNLNLLDRLTQSAAAEAADSLKLPPGTSLTLLSQTPTEGSSFVIRRLADALTQRGHRVQMLLSEPAPEEPAEPEAGAQGGAPGGANGGGAANPFREQWRQEHAQNGDGNGAAPDSSAAFADSVAEAEGYAREEAPPAGEEVPSAPHPASLRPETGVLPEGEVLDIEVLEFGVNYANASRKLMFGPVRFARVAGTYFQVSHLEGPEGTLKRVVSVERHEVDRLAGWQKVLAEGATYPFTKPELQSPSVGRYVEPAVVVGIVTSLIYLFYQNQN